MTANQLQSFINKLNKGTYHKTIFKHQISKEVDFAKVWQSQNTKEVQPFNFFFIKNNDEYIGAVLLMCNDLHWYITPRYRGKGYLTNALKKIILPYIFDELGREEQKITITESEIGKENYKCSSNVALNIGFKKLDDINFVLKASDVAIHYDDTDKVYDGLDRSEVSTIKKELNTIAKRLHQINTQLENAFGKEVNEYSNTSLKDMSIKVEFCKFAVVDDMLNDYENNQKINSCKQ